MRFFQYHWAQFTAEVEDLSFSESSSRWMNNGTGISQLRV